MDWIHPLTLGLGVALTPQNLACAVAGGVLGLLIGVLPGLGVAAAIAMLLPSVHGLEATPALILLAGVYAGARYGGASAAILGHVPGPSSLAATAIEGHSMARQGRAGVALTVATLSSLFAAGVGTALIAGVAPLLSALALAFEPADAFALMTLGLIGAAVMAPGSLLKALAMAVLGLLLSQVGPDPSPGTQRFSLDLPGLSDGIGLAVLAIGLIGLGDIIRHLGQPAALREAVTDSVHARWPSRQDAQECGPAVLRGTALGALMGLLPGAGAWRASSASGSMEKKIAGARGRFGKGDVRGVAGPESAHSAGAQTSFIAVLALGLPLNAVMALMAGALLIQGLPPGPQLIASHPQLLWGLLGSMWVGQLVLAVVNLSLTGWWLRLLAVPYRHVFPVLTLLCCIGVYTLRGSSFDLYLVAFVAACGYAFHKLGCETAPLLLGFVLGPRMEDQLRGALRMSDGDWSLFLARPLSAALLVAAAGLLLAGLLPATRRERGAAFHDAD
jgi:TctA family transporter